MRRHLVGLFITFAVLPYVPTANAQEATAVAPVDNPGALDSDAALTVWRCMDEEAGLRVTSTPANVREGAGALELIYTPREGAFAMLRGQLAPEPGAQSIRFSIKVTEPTPLMYGVVEADDSHYVGYMYVTPGAFREEAVSLDELQLGEGSEDENGKLDVDQIQSVVFADLSNLGGEAGRALGWKTGEQMLWLDSVAVAAAPAKRRVSVIDSPAGTEVVVADFSLDRIDGMALGGAELTRVPDGGGSALSIGYSVGGWRWAGFVSSLPSVPLERLQVVRLRAKTALGCQLHVLLEERDKARYVSVVPVPADGKWHDVEIPLDSFRLDEFSVDQNGQLDPSQLRVIIVVLDTFSAGIDRTNSGALLVDDVRLALAPGDASAEQWPAWTPFGR